MFAPPPVLLSRAEIQTRLVDEEKGAERNELPERILESPNSLHQNEPKSPISPFKRLFFGKGDRSKALPQTPPAPNSPSPERQDLSGEVTNRVRPELEGVDILPAGFGEHPRRAPAPPTKAAPILNERTLWTPPLPGAFPPVQEPIQESTNGDDTPPPIPPKSSRRPTLQSLGLEISQPPWQQVIASERPRHAPVSRQKVNGYSTTSSRTLERASTAPSATGRRHIRSNLSRVRSGTAGMKPTSHDAVYLRQKTSVGVGPANVRDARVHKSSTASRQTLNSPYHGWFKPNPSTNAEEPQRRASDSVVGLGNARVRRELEFATGSPRNVSPTNLLNGAGFVQKKSIAPKKNFSHVRTWEAVPHRLKFIDKELPATPTGIHSSPTEMYEYAQKSPPLGLKYGSRMLEKSKRSPLAQVSPNSSGFTEEGISPNRLSAIPEHTTSGEKSPIASGSTTPVITHIHLRGGSRVMLSPPELTAWQLNLYIQGPIKLPKPVIVPRKNSVASLDPFQEAIDQVYQDALNMPRRRSDDKVLDDVCDFFDDFGFEEAGLRSYNFGPDEMDVDSIANMGDNVPERFSTPPVEVTPVEKTIARDFVERLSTTTQLSQPSLAVQSVETEDMSPVKSTVSLTHRVAAQASLYSQARKDSMTLSVCDPVMQAFAQRAQETVLDGVFASSQQPEDQAVDRNHGIAEADASSPTAAAPKKYGLLSGKVRKLVTTATSRS